jgi:hypothetical protein
MLPPPSCGSALDPLWRSMNHRPVAIERKFNLFVKQINEYANIKILLAMAVELDYQFGNQ